MSSSISSIEAAIARCAALEAQALLLHGDDQDVLGSGSAIQAVMIIVIVNVDVAATTSLVAAGWMPSVVSPNQHIRFISTALSFEHACALADLQMAALQAAGLHAKRLASTLHF